MAISFNSATKAVTKVSTIVLVQRKGSSEGGREGGREERRKGVTPTEFVGFCGAV